jgi:ribonuclease G
VPPPGRARHRLFVAVRGDHRWAAVLDDDRPVEFHCESKGDEPRIGDIYLGRIARVDQSLGAAFVDIGRKQAAFLPLSEIRAPAVEGSGTIIQIEREGLGGKAPRATARPVLAGARLVLSPGRGSMRLSERITDKPERERLSALAKGIAEPEEGITIRRAAVGATESQLRQEAEALRAAWRAVLDRRRSQPPPTVLERHLPLDLRLLRDLGWSLEAAVYDHRGAADAARAWCETVMGDLAPTIQFQKDTAWLAAPAEILEHVESAIQPRVALQSGGSLSIESTEAMTVIDVDVGSAAALRPNEGSERIFLRTNLAAAMEIARQIRLRNVGGIIVVDFIDLKSAAERRQVVDCLRGAVAADSAPVWVGSMSRLGLVELTRKRRGPTLSDMLTRPCPGCDGTGRLMRDDSWVRATGAAE